MRSYTLCSKIVFGLLSAIVIMTLALPGTSAWADDICPGTYVGIRTAGLRPYVQLQVDDKKGWFFVDLGASYSIVDTQTFGMSLYESKDLKISGFPYIDHEMFTARDFHNFKIGGDQVLGVIGENVLSLVSVQFRYDAESPYLVISPDSCTPYLKDNPDFVKIDQAGLYVRDRRHLKDGEPNMPRLYVQVAGVRGSMVMDSGDDDFIVGDMPGAVHMNVSFIEALQRKNIMQMSTFLLDRTPCGGTDPIPDSIPTWTVNEPLQIIDADGNVVFQYIQATTIKSMATLAECGFISLYPTPLGLLPVSYIRRLGTVVVDAPGEAVWLRKSTMMSVAQLPRLDSEWRPENGSGTYTDPYGTIYDGNFLNGLPEGRGTWHLLNGDTYTGMNHAGKPDGKGTWLTKDGTAFRGTFRSWGFVDGEVTNSVNDRFVGPFQNWLPEGEGTWQLHTGAEYTGGNHNGKLNGHGKWLDRKNGTAIEGEFSNGDPVSADFVNNKGDHYKGPFKDWLPEGHGVYFVKNTGTYDADFHNGLPLRGSLTTLSGEHYEGPLQNWLPEGHGVFQIKTTGTYDANFHNGVPMQGYLSLLNGDHYEGPFQNWQPNGRGTYYRRADNKTYRVVYNNGAFVGYW